MAEGQKKRKLGQNMKARGKKADKPQETTEVTEHEPTAEGQPESILEPVLSRQNPVETSHYLEPEKVQILDPQNDPQCCTTVPVPQTPTAVPDSTQDALEKALEESVDDPHFTEFCVHDIPMGQSCEKCQSAAAENQLTSDGTGEVRVINEADNAKVFVGVDFGSKEDTTVYLTEVGPMPDGSQKCVVTVPEGYWEAVKQWAESDGISPEEWLSQRLYEYVTSFGNAPKGR